MVGVFHYLLMVALFVQYIRTLAPCPTACVLFPLSPAYPSSCLQLCRAVLSFAITSFVELCFLKPSVCRTVLLLVLAVVFNTYARRLIRKSCSHLPRIAPMAKPLKRATRQPVGRPLKRSHFMGYFGIKWQLQLRRAWYFLKSTGLIVFTWYVHNIADPCYVTGVRGKSRLVVPKRTVPIV